MVMLFCGCAVNSRFGKNRLLTQKQIVGKWIEESPVPITFEEAFKIRNDFEANYIILPKNSDVQIEKVIELFFNWCIPGGRTWLYTTPELDLDFYVYLPATPAFPVTSRGVTMQLACPYRSEIRAEDIYLVTDTVVCHYDSLHLADAGWMETGRNTFTFNIPPNTSGRERFWQVNLYNKNREDDIRVNRGSAPYIDDEEVPEEYKKCHPAISKLRFIQVTDSFNPASLNEAYYRRYTKKLPYPNKTNYD